MAQRDDLSASRKAVCAYGSYSGIRIFLKLSCFYCLLLLILLKILWVHAVAQLVEALPNDPEGRGFLFGCCHWNFSFFIPSSRTMALRSTQSIIKMSTRNISWWGQGIGGRCLWLTTITHSCDDSLEIWEPQPSGTIRVYPDLSRNCFSFALLPPPKLAFRCFVSLCYAVPQREKAHRRMMGS